MYYDYSKIMLAQLQTKCIFHDFFVSSICYRPTDLSWEYPNFFLNIFFVFFLPFSKSIISLLHFLMLNVFVFRGFLPEIKKKKNIRFNYCRIFAKVKHCALCYTLYLQNYRQNGTADTTLGEERQRSIKNCANKKWPSV